MPFLPPMTPFNIAVSAIQTMAMLTSWKSELAQPAAYSKFADDDTKAAKVPSRVGMLIIYTPALCVCCWAVANFGAAGDVYALLSWALFAHFAKRDLEVLFLHKYSGSTETLASVMIGQFYALTSALVLYSASLSTLEWGWNVPLGLAIFAVGQLGNLYHHWLMAGQRPDAAALKGPKRYVVPHGGLFEYVTMPHYFFEIVAWFGVFALAPRLNMLLVVLSMISYLGGRSVSTTRWYQEKFQKEWPAERKHLVPFVF